MLRNWSYLGRIGPAAVLIGLLALGWARPARAADFRTGQDVVIGADEVIDDDLFVSGDRVEMNGTVKGDLFATGAQVIVNGTVEGSLVVAGRETEINGRVEGSAYGGAYSLTLGPEASIGRNLYFGGYSLATESGSTIGRSLYIGGYQAVLDGEVAREARAGLGALELDGKVGGDVYLEVGEPDPGFGKSAPFMFPGMPASVTTIDPGVRLGPNADVGGNLWYQSDAEQSIPAAAVGGEIIRATPEPAAPNGRPSEVVRANPGSRLFEGFGRRAGEFIALIIVGGLLLRFWPEGVRRPSAEVQAQPLRSTGRGMIVAFIFFIGVPLAAIAIFVAALLGGLVTYGQLFGAILGLGAAALGLTISVFLIVLSLVTKVIVAYVAGRAILLRTLPQWLAGRWADLLALGAGALVYEILRAIPGGLGWVISLLVTMVGLGAIYVVAREALRRPAAVPPASPATVAA